MPGDVNPQRTSRPNPRSGWLAIIGGLTLLLALGLGAWVWRAEAWLDARAARARSEIAAWRRRPETRRVPLSSPSVEGNAALAWREPHPADPRFDPTLEAEALFVRTLSAPTRDKCGPNLYERRAAQAEAFFSAHGERILAPLRRGARSTECRWELELEAGLSAALPDLRTLRTGVRLMFVAAMRAPAAEQAPRILEVLQVILDIQQIGYAASDRVAMALRSELYKTIGALWRQGLPISELERIAAADATPPSLIEATAAERLALDATMAQVAGRPLDGIPRFRAHAAYAFAPIAAREWRLLDSARAHVEQALSGPPDELDADLDAIADGLVESHAYVSQTALPLLGGWARQRRHHLTDRHAFLLGCAAARIYAETGHWPSSLDELPRADARLDLTAEPPAPLRLEVCDGRPRTLSIRGADDRRVSHWASPRR